MTFVLAYNSKSILATSDSFPLIMSHICISAHWTCSYTKNEIQNQCSDFTHVLCVIECSTAICIHRAVSTLCQAEISCKKYANMQPLGFTLQCIVLAVTAVFSDHMAF